MARAFLVELRKRPTTEEMIGDRGIDEWLDWAEARAAVSDPLERGTAVLFSEIADVSEYSYHD